MADTQVERARRTRQANATRLAYDAARLAYVNGSSDEYDEPMETQVADLIADLLHLLENEGYGPEVIEGIHSRSYGQYSAERN